MLGRRKFLTLVPAAVAPVLLIRKSSLTTMGKLSQDNPNFEGQVADEFVSLVRDMKGKPAPEHARRMASILRMYDAHLAPVAPTLDAQLDATKGSVFIDADYVRNFWSGHGLDLSDIKMRSTLTDKEVASGRATIKRHGGVSGFHQYVASQLDQWAKTHGAVHTIALDDGDPSASLDCLCLALLVDAATWAVVCALSGGVLLPACAGAAIMALAEVLMEYVFGICNPKNCTPGKDDMGGCLS